MFRSENVNYFPPGLFKWVSHHHFWYVPMPDQPAPSVSSPAWHSGSAWSPLICREIRRIWRRRSADLSCGMTATICLHMTTYYVCIVNYDYICFYLYAHKVVKICLCTYTCLSLILFLLLWLFTIPEVLKCY